MTALDRLNALPDGEAETLLGRVCGSTAWARAVAARRPFDDAEALKVAAEDAWDALGEEDWLEAVAAHPRIGESVDASGAKAGRWSRGEQAGAAGAGASVREELAELQRAYERRFGFGFLIRATGRSAEEILAACRARIGNERETELAVAAREEREIGRIRIGKLLKEGGPP